MRTTIKTRTSVSLSPPELRWLKARAKRLGISVSEFLRRIVDEKMNKETTNA